MEGAAGKEGNRGRCYLHCKKLIYYVVKRDGSIFWVVWEETARQASPYSDYAYCMDTCMKVYCEHHAVRQWLRGLQKKGRITLVLFPYDQRTRRIKEIATPSEATWEELNINWDEGDFSWDEFSPSSHYNDICNIIGEENIRDVKHIDSAFKSKCQCMLTCDNDILSHSQELEELLNIMFFHPDNHREKFIVCLKRYEQKKTHNISLKRRRGVNH